jgi:hypothetical protein
MPSKRTEPTVRPTGREGRSIGARHALAAARFADQRERFAGSNVERNPINRSGDSVLGKEVRLEIPYLQQRRRHAASHPARNARVEPVA